jgi:hypothetical protein
MSLLKVHFTIGKVGRQAAKMTFSPFGVSLLHIKRSDTTRIFQRHSRKRFALCSAQPLRFDLLVPTVEFILIIENGESTISRSSSFDPSTIFSGSNFAVFSSVIISNPFLLYLACW